MKWWIINLFEFPAYAGNQGGPGPLAYGGATSSFPTSGAHFGASGPAQRVYPGPNAYQGFAGISPFGKSYQQPAFQPQSYQSQQQAY